VGAEGAANRAFARQCLSHQERQLIAAGCVTIASKAVLLRELKGPPQQRCSDRQGLRHQAKRQWRCSRTGVVKARMPSAVQLPQVAKGIDPRCCCSCVLKSAKSPMARYRTSWQDQFGPLLSCRPCSPLKSQLSAVGRKGVKTHGRVTPVCC
jgi:hypothetical protein